MPDIRQLQMFVAAAEEGHFGTAARRSHISQSGLSRSISSLEEELGVRLFERTSRQVRLTDAGEVYLSYARGIVRASQEAKRAAEMAAAGLKGTLTIGYMDLAIADFLPRCIARYRSIHPDIDVQLQYGWSSKQRDDLLAGNIDIGFVVDLPDGDDEIEGFTARRQRLVAVLGKEHRLAGRTSLQLSDLSGESFVFGIRREWQGLRGPVERLCRQAGFSCRVVQEAPTRDGIFGYVAAGLGITVYTDVAFRVPRSDILVLPLRDVREPIAIRAIWLKRNRRLVARNFLLAIVSELRLSNHRQVELL